MNTTEQRAEARSRANRRLRNMTIGTAILAVAATGSLGWAAAITYNGASTQADLTAAVVTTTVGDTTATDATSTTSGATSSDATSSGATSSGATSSGATSSAATSSAATAPLVSSASGGAHVSTGGS